MSCIMLISENIHIFSIALQYITFYFVGFSNTFDKNRLSFTFDQGTIIYVEYEIPNVNKIDTENLRVQTAFLRNS
jgi:hypothetical protein